LYEKLIQQALKQKYNINITSLTIGQEFVFREVSTLITELNHFKKTKKIRL